MMEGSLETTTASISEKVEMVVNIPTSATNVIPSMISLRPAEVGLQKEAREEAHKSANTGRERTPVCTMAQVRVG